MRRLALLLISVSVASCGDRAALPVSAGTGPAPTLPKPDKTLFPTIDVADAKGWPQGVTPVAAPGLAVNAFATGLQHPRWILPLPNGDLLVSEASAPPQPDDHKGIKAFFMGLFLKKAGAAVPSANRISLLRDTDGDGVAEMRTELIGGLNTPIGMALVGNQLYIADTDALLRVPFTPGQTRITAQPVKIADLPAGTRNHHWVKTVTPSPDGQRMFVSVGSNSNAAEHGMAIEQGRAAIWEIDPASGAHRVFASGLRNPNAMAFAPGGNTLWTVVNERDELGSDLVPDYLTSVREGGFYGWPYSYYGQHVDTRVKPQRPDLVASAIVPDYALGPHTASLGLAFSTGQRLGPAYAEGAFIGQHGSWNRKPPSGYRVIFVPFSGGRPSGPPVDVLTGFRIGDIAHGRPVQVAIGALGALFVADDVGNTVWRVTAAR
ncbi:MAG: sorbosone dehydrogenase family protein [Proteobacteria bacterium]|nr:sorbosone dehydrogenase family protein [Pseudomonadota bacterium]